MGYHDNSRGLLDPNKLYAVDEAVDFLRKIWQYSSLDAKCYSIITIGDRVRTRLYCLDDSSIEDTCRREANTWVCGTFPALFRQVKNDLGGILPEAAESGDHVYYQILPLAEKPDKGRGSEKHVKVGRWLWADLDYKRVVEKAEFEDCKEGEDYELECYYQDGGKWVHVKRPPLSQVMGAIREKLGVEPTAVVDSGNGYHFYFKLIYEIDAKKLKQLETMLVDLLGADRQSKDLVRALRLPGSINPRNGRPVKVIYEASGEVDPEELEGKLASATPAGSQPAEVARVKPSPENLRELSDTGIIRIVDLLREAYKPGHRQHMALFLSGWLAKANISPVSVAKIIKGLHESTGDEEPLKTRLSVIPYTYYKLWQSRDEVLKYVDEIEKVLGVKPYSTLGDVEIEEPKGKSGLQEILEETLGSEEKALAVIKELEDIVGTASPFRDSIFEIMDYEKQLYAIVNLHKLIVARVRRGETGFKYKERVFVGAPTSVEVYVNPLGGVTKYKVTWETQTRPRPLEIGPATIDDILSRLKAEGLVIHHRLAGDVLNTIIEGFIRKGKASVKEEIEAPGFYLVGGKIVTVRVEVKQPGQQELRSALELLNELATVWYGHAVDRFSLVVKWGAISPFIYAIKQLGKWVPWLFLYGASGSGKTTLGEIVLAMWGLGLEFNVPGANIDTPARLGHRLSRATFPVVVREPGNVLNKDDNVEMLKSSIESTIARGRFERGTYTEIPALGAVIFTSNKYLPRDDALLRRLIVLRFTFKERADPNRAKEFDEKIRPKLKQLASIGQYIAHTIVSNPDLLKNDWHELAVKLLEDAYRAVGMEPPRWIYEKYQPEDNVYDDIREAVRIYLTKRINEEYTRFVGKVLVETGHDYRAVHRTDVSFAERVKTVLSNRLLPWAFIKVVGENPDGNDPGVEYVYITSGIVNELVSITGDIGGLKSLAELLNWEYADYTYRENKQVKHIKVARVPIQSFIEFLSMPEESPEK